jgi:hypothetical protein
VMLRSQPTVVARVVWYAEHFGSDMRWRYFSANERPLASKRSPSIPQMPGKRSVAATTGLPSLTIGPVGCRVMGPGWWEAGRRGGHGCCDAVAFSALSRSLPWW